LGALGVGIGFGLQNIVNNLVSGVPLHRKTHTSRRTIEVGVKWGWERQARSSKINTMKALDIIVPYRRLPVSI